MKRNENCSTCRFWAWPVGPVALTKNGNWCRYADWRLNLYHQIKWVSSLVAVPHDLPLPPALKWILTWKRQLKLTKHHEEKNRKRKPNKQQKLTSSGRSFLFIQMFHTHAPQQRGCFVQRQYGMSRSSYQFPGTGYINEIKMQGKKCK